MNRYGRPAWMVLVVSLGACGDGSRPPATVTDSAGVQIRSFSARRDEIPSVDVQEAVIQIGALDGEGPEVFGSVRDVGLTDRHLTVIDGQAREIRVFSLAGDHVATFGGEGSGPGEFRLPTQLELRGDTAVVWDFGSQRVSWFHLDGEFLRSHPLRGQGPVRSPVGVPDGWVARRPASAGAPVESTDGFVTVRDTAVFQAFDSTGEPGEDLFRLPDAERVEMVQVDGEVARTRSTGVPFSRGAYLAGEGAGLVGGTSDRFEVRRWSADGTLRGIDRYPDLQRPITDETVRAYSESLEPLAREAPDFVRQLRGLLDTMDHPPFLPAFTAIRRDADGRLWLREYTLDERETWLVLSGVNGVPLVRFRFPVRFQLLTVAGGRVAGRWRDSLDVSYVQVYEIPEP